MSRGIVAPINRFTTELRGLGVPVIWVLHANTRIGSRSDRELFINTIVADKIRETMRLLLSFSSDQPQHVSVLIEPGCCALAEHEIHVRQHFTDRKAHLVRIERSMGKQNWDKFGRRPRSNAARFSYGLTPPLVMFDQLAGARG
jgi:hypothetical protein